MKKLDDIPCGWAPAHDDLYRRYHDEEWGVPERDSRALWEKAPARRHAGRPFLDHHPAQARDHARGVRRLRAGKIARWTPETYRPRHEEPGHHPLAPSRSKPTIRNAQVYLDMAERDEDFSDYVWGFVDGKPIVNKLDHWRNVQAKTELSEVIAKDMKKRGFKFCGPVIVYAVMQAMGMVNDHEVRCPRHKEIQKLEKSRRM
jgi:DNA-3-methyladenine glycosylase I